MKGSCGNALMQSERQGVGELDSFTLLVAWAERERSVEDVWRMFSLIAGLRLTPLGFS